MTDKYHKPIQPPRERHFGEAAFYKGWLRVMRMDGDNYSTSESPALERVLGVLLPSPRRAEVAASFAVFLGCNGGRQIINRGRKKRAAGTKYATLMAWAEQNVRSIHINSGIRIMDCVLAKKEDYGQRFLEGYGLVVQPQYSADDIEVIERVCLWLDTPEGIDYVAACEKAEKRAVRMHMRQRKPLPPSTGVLSVDGLEEES